MAWSTLMRGAVVAVAAGLAITFGTTLGVDDPWALLLVAGVAFAPRMTPGTILSILLGAASWWAAMGLRAGVLRDTTSGEVMAALAAVAIVTVIAAATRDRVPLWAALVGIGAFAGVYEPQFATNPTLFTTESPIAFVSLGVATSIAALASVLAGWLEGLLIDRRAGAHADLGGKAVTS